jgi:hypothetical protein
MSWQLWVLVATVVAGGVGLFVLKLRHAQEVFDEIVSHPDRPTSDEAAARRREREPVRRRAISHQPNIAGHRRHH